VRSCRLCVPSLMKRTVASREGTYGTGSAPRREGVDARERKQKQCSDGHVDCPPWPAEHRLQTTTETCSGLWLFSFKSVSVAFCPCHPLGIPLESFGRRPEGGVTSKRTVFETWLNALSKEPERVCHEAVLMASAVSTADHDHYQRRLAPPNRPASWFLFSLLSTGFFMFDSCWVCGRRSQRSEVCKVPPCEACCDVRRPHSRAEPPAWPGQGATATDGLLGFLGVVQFDGACRFWFGPW